MKKYKIIIFDMDGTILNTAEDLKDSINHILTKYGYESKSIEQVKSYFGNGLRKALERALPKEDPYSIDFKEILDEFFDYYMHHCDIKTTPYEGIVDCIKKVKENGYLTAVISNKKQEIVDPLCDKFFKGLFDKQIGEVEGINKKPDPTSINNLLKEYNIKKEEALYVGDSEVDLQTASNANIDCIAVSYGFRSKEFLIANKAKTIIDKPSDLLSLLIN